MNPNAILRQTARGPMIHLEAVHEGLRGDRICAAGLDVRRQEPLDRRTLHGPTRNPGWKAASW